LDNFYLFNFMKNKNGARYPGYRSEGHAKERASEACSRAANEPTASGSLTYLGGEASDHGNK
jgi:hypothetical protein